MSDPLILTLQMETETYDRFEALRQEHFPEALNRVPAHVTLFHQLPGGDQEAVTETIAAYAKGQAPPEVAVTGIRFIGRGVAYVLQSDALARFRGMLATHFASALTPQDRQPWRPHVTVQNKVDPATARALQSELEARFAPFRFSAPGILLWRYKGGPWEPVAALLFGGDR